MQNIRSILDCFERFGEIEAVCIHSQHYLRYGFVTFKMARCAEKACRHKFHFFGKNLVPVELENHWHQNEPEDPLLTPPEPDSTQQILNKLDDDCLRAIFQFLNMIDLCNAAEVCKAFKQHAQEAFSSNYQDKIIQEFKSLSKHEVESLLSNFGPSIVKLDAKFNGIKHFCGQNDFLSKIQTKCRNLKVLKLTEFCAFGLELRPMFSKLERLSLAYCELNNEMLDLLSDCQKLKTLELDFCATESGDFINQKFPMLEEITLERMEGTALSGFLTSNPTLKKFTARYCGSKFVANLPNLPNLTQLEISYVDFEDECDFQRIILFLGQLKSLQVLNIQLQSHLITPLVTSLATNKAPITHLMLSFGEFDDNTVVDGLSQLKQIEMLDLAHIENLTDDHLMDLAIELPELNELRLRHISPSFGFIAIKKLVKYAKKLSFLGLESSHCIEIDVDDYKAVLKSVQRRPENVKLMIQIIADEYKVNVPEEMMNAHREWLYIDTN